MLNKEKKAITVYYTAQRLNISAWETFGLTLVSSIYYTGVTVGVTKVGMHFDITLSDPNM